MKLKPCPFCGGKAHMVTSVYDDGYMAEVYCTSGADVGCFAFSKHWALKESWVKETAVKAWNRRAK